MNTVIKNLITIIWKHGHGCGAAIERDIADKHTAINQRSMRCERELTAALPTFGKRVTDMLSLMMAQIPPYITEKANGFDWYKYLHICGGSGVKPTRQGPDHRSGGEYDIVLFYAAPDDMKDKGEMCDRLWCIGKDIVYGEGETIYHAYQNYLTKIKTITNAKEATG